MSEKANERSAVEGLFGAHAVYPLTEPRKAAQMQKRRWRVWHHLTSVWATLPVWLTLALVPTTVITGIYELWLSEIGIAVWLFITGMYCDGGERSPHDRPYLPAFWRWYHGVSAEPYSPEERQVLEVVWRLEESINRLRDAYRRLEAQISAKDVERIQGFEEQARAALARGERLLAQSLLEAKGEAESHTAGVKEQLARLSDRLHLLEDKQYHLKSRLAVRHLRERAIAAQADAHRADAAAVTAVGLTALEPVTIGIPDGGLEQLRSDALEAEAHVQALLELGQPLKPSAELLSGAALEEALEELKLEVSTRQATAVV